MSASASVPDAAHTAEAILAHPRFAAARMAFVEAVLALHEGDQFRSRLLVEAMRQVTFNLIVSLHLRHDPSDRATWPTPRRLKDEIRTFGLASDRRIDALVSRLVQLGYVEQRTPEEDGRVRLLVPTDKMMSLDREWLYYHHVPLHVLFPDDYAEPMAHDPAFQRAHRLVALEFSAKGAEIMGRHPAVIRFMGRDSGILVLIKLIQMQMSAGKGGSGLSYADIGARFGISRTHVRALLEDAAEHGDVSLSGTGRLVALEPSILKAFDRFLADAMAGHDMIYRLALKRMEKA